MHPVRQTFETFVLPGAPPAVREELLSLPQRMGVSEQCRGGWEDFSKLPIMFDLPRFFASAGMQVATSRRAHHVAGMLGLALDRIADGQCCQQTDATSDALGWLRRRWIEALDDDMCPDPPEPQVAAAEEQWRTGLSVDANFRARGSVRPYAYAQNIVHKVRWLALSTWRMLGSVATSRAQTFTSCFDQLLVGLQARDDALDSAEDAQLFGMSAPALLDCTPKALFLAGAHMLEQVHTQLRDAGFGRAADNVALLSRANAPLSGEPLLAAIEALPIVIGLQDACVTKRPLAVA